MFKMDKHSTFHMVQEKLKELGVKTQLLLEELLDKMPG
jgi:hypothetical protein